jgi:hypothetical protein
MEALSIPNAFEELPGCAPAAGFYVREAWDAAELSDRDIRNRIEGNGPPHTHLLCLSHI